MKRNNTWKSSYFWRIFLVLVITSFMLLGIIFVVSNLILPKIAKDQFRDMTDSAVNRLTHQINMFAENVQMVASTVQQEEKFISNDPLILQAELKKVVKASPFFDGGSVTDKYGGMLSDYSLDLLEYKQVSYLGYLQDFDEKKKPFLSHVITKNDSNQSILLLSVPIYNSENQLYRVVHLSIHLLKEGLFQSMFKDLYIGSESYAYIVDQKGKLVAHPRQDLFGQDVSDNKIVQELLAKNSGYLHVTNTLNVELYSSYQYVPEVEWGVVAQVPVESTLVSVKEFNKSLWAVSVIVMILITILAAIHAIMTIKPLRKLSLAVDQVASGNFELPFDTITGKDEIGILSHKFSEMIHNLDVTRTELLQKELMLKSQKEFLQYVIDKSPSAIYIMDWEGKFTFVNEAYANILGTTSQDLVGKKELYFNPNRDDVEKYLEINRQVMETREEIFIPDALMMDSQGNERWMQVSKTPIIENGECKHTLCFATDITDRIKNEEKIRYHAFHDSLTNLPNRSKFKMCLEEEIDLCLQDDTKLAVLFMDLDRFKYVNDTFGHSMGDKLLQAVSERLQNCLNERDIISRLGGDEFTVILPCIDQKEQVTSIASKLIHALAQPYQIDQLTFATTTSIGISMFPHDGEDVETLIKHADTAMYQAKEQGKNTYRFYTEEMKSLLSNKLILESHLRNAIANEEFHLHYQPKMDTKTGKMSGMEALIRWEQKDLGMISPAKFIPIAEECGLIVPIGEWVLREACLQTKKWQDAGYHPIKVAVNLSVIQLQNNSIVESVKEIITETGIDPVWLELEITESAIMKNRRATIRTLKQLKKIGVSIAIDDFGAGYSSLHYLKRFPVDTLKIDRSFISELLTDQNDTVIVSAVIALANKLGLNVVAEGVENEDQLNYLHDLHCHEVQGFLISSPLPTKEFEKLLDKEKLFYRSMV
ncbi:EAL domain-containing protein [Bacillus salitolerans]|uniref:EAL domain-containing protein n=1 Tax=Bacillus salitolerans TaxID=1437434 RepID=A0ABW4LNM4_9BACI